MATTSTTTRREDGGDHRASHRSRRAPCSHPTTRDAGEPGVRLRCYLDLRQPVGSDASAHVPPQVFAEVQR
ncbi:DUF6207 family protein [Streptomyces sp. NPDC029554]|uniref:DUF6207 family protein n=1 Tax=Streptomyces sp. NPDC029554 TaxID=3155126 RepID=UPI0033E27613